jgi:hypothetical protein
MLDPTRTQAATGSGLIVGQNVPVFMTGGITAAAMTGTKITSITTTDGRTVTGKVFFDGSYDGDLIRLAGVPYQIGREAAGTNNEASAGYRGNANNLKPQTALGGTQLDIDPYITPGSSASGRIYGVIADPAITDGAADPVGIQPLNKRLTWSGIVSRMAPIAVNGSPPAGYAASKYEIFARIFAASTAAGITYPIASLLKIDSTAGVFDVNNGEGRISTDHLNSGLTYAAAGTSFPARKAVFDHVQSWISGLMYWLLYSGDARIPAALITSLQGYYLDPFCHLDPGSSGTPLFWPKNAYRREPLYLMKNASYKFDANDMDGNNRPDGSAPRSNTTVTTVSYALDVHSIRVMDTGGLVAIQGAVYNATAQYAGGVNFITPFPLEAIVPDASACTNLISSVSVSSSRLAYGSYRMEPTMGMAAEVAAAVAKNAIDNNIAVQAVDYPTVRSAALAAGDTIALTLTQVN